MTTALRAQLRASTRYLDQIEAVSLAASLVAAAADTLGRSPSHFRAIDARHLTEAVQRLNQHFTALNNTLRTGEG